MERLSDSTCGILQVRINIGWFASSINVLFSRFRALNYDESDIFIILYAIDDLDSYENVQSQWHPELNFIKPEVPIVLIGTKSDLRDQNPESIAYTQGKALAKNISAERFMETTINLANSVILVFEEIIKIFCKFKKVALDPNKSSLKKVEKQVPERPERVGGLKRLTDRLTLRREKKKPEENIVSDSLENQK